MKSSIIDVDDRNSPPKSTSSAAATAAAWASSLVSDYSQRKNNDEGGKATTTTTHSDDDDDDDGTSSSGCYEYHPPARLSQNTTSNDQHEKSLPSFSSSSSSSPFRKSLDEEHRAKQQQQQKLPPPPPHSQVVLLEKEDETNTPQQLLRASLASFTVDVDSNNNNNNNVNHHGPSSSSSNIILTTTERNFLESILNLPTGPQASEICMAAHSILMDGNVFFGTMCAGSAGEVVEKIPGHHWTTTTTTTKNNTTCSSSSCMTTTMSSTTTTTTTNGTNHGTNDDNNNCHPPPDKELPIIGTSAILPSQEEEVPSLLLPPPSKSTFEVVATADAATSTTTTTTTTSSDGHRRLSRLEERRRQSLLGKDVTHRLFRAHEAGIVVTPGGSARRSLLRMGLSFLPPPPPPPMMMIMEPPTITSEVATSTTTKTTPEETVADIIMENATSSVDLNTKSLANYVDERTILRQMDKEERTKQQQQQLARQLSITTSAAAAGGIGCLSPFNMNVLRNMFASKQFSFHRSSSSSYSRYDSFLQSTKTTDHPTSSTSTDVGNNDFMNDSTTTTTTSTSTVGVEERKSSIRSKKNNDIFRPSPSASTAEERFRNLLIHAGFIKNDEDDENNSKFLLVDAATEDDVELMRGTSSTDDSVALLMKNGGPSFQDVTMFRDKKSYVVNQPSSATTTTTTTTTTARADTISEEHMDKGYSLDKPPSLSLSESEARRRSNTVGIIKPPSFRTLSPPKKGRYSRSVSWGHMVVVADKDGGGASAADGTTILSNSMHAPAMTHTTSSDMNDGGMSVITFPNLRKAVPLRSDSLGSISTSLPPLRLGAPIRSDSTMSISSILSPFPLSRANPIFSPMASFASIPPPALSLATAIRSDSQMTMESNIDDDHSLTPTDCIDAKANSISFNGGGAVAWEYPAQRSNDYSVYLRQASTNNYDGMGIEMEHSPLLETIDNARKYRSLLSNGDYSTRSSSMAAQHCRRSVSTTSARPPIQCLDDSFIIKNINFERHASEILRSLSNEDLHSSHHLETIHRGSSRASGSGGGNNDQSSVAVRISGNPLNESWDLESSASAAVDAWGVLEDEYAEGYGAFNTLPFYILGTFANDTACHPHVLSPPLMESLQNFLPPAISEQNFWLKYSLVRDGASLPSLLRNIRGTRRTIIAIETVEGEVFGSFTSFPWRKNWNYYGNGESFLWRMRRSRSEKDIQHSILDQAKLESELEIFNWSGKNNLVQYCSHSMLAIGGGLLRDDEKDDDRCLDKQPDLGGFGLAIDSDLLRGTSSPCATFQSPPLSKSHTDGSPFEILNMEVWTLTPCSSITEAESIEMTALFLETYNRRQ